MTCYNTMVWSNSQCHNSLMFHKFKCSEYTQKCLSLLIDTFTCCLLCIPTGEMLLSYALICAAYIFCNSECLLPLAWYEFDTKELLIYLNCMAYSVILTRIYMRAISHLCTVMQTLILSKNKPKWILLPMAENKTWSSNAVQCLFYCHLVRSNISQA